MNGEHARVVNARVVSVASQGKDGLDLLKVVGAGADRAGVFAVLGDSCWSPGEEEIRVAANRVRHSPDPGVQPAAVGSQPYPVEPARFRPGVAPARRGVEGSRPVAARRSSRRRRGGSSAGQSKGLIIPRSWVRSPPAPHLLHDSG